MNESGGANPCDYGGVVVVVGLTVHLTCKCRVLYTADLSTPIPCLCAFVCVCVFAVEPICQPRDECPVSVRVCACTYVYEGVFLSGRKCLPIMLKVFDRNSFLHHRKTMPDMTVSRHSQKLKVSCCLSK